MHMIYMGERERKREREREREREKERERILLTHLDLPIIRPSCQHLTVSAKSHTDN